MRRPWLRSTRFLAGAPTTSASPPGRVRVPLDEPDDGVREPEEGSPAERLLVAAFLVAVARAEPFVAVAASGRTLGGPMAGEW